MYACVYMCIYVYICVYMCIYVYICVYTLPFRHATTLQVNSPQVSLPLLGICVLASQNHVHESFARLLKQNFPLCVFFLQFICGRYTTILSFSFSSFHFSFLFHPSSPSLHLSMVKLLLILLILSLFSSSMI